MHACNRRYVKRKNLIKVVDGPVEWLRGKAGMYVVESGE